MDHLDKNTYNIKTYGCKVNTYDSGLIQKQLAGDGLEVSKDSQVHILNTCAVTAEASKEALREIRKIKRKNPESTIVVTGCSAQIDTELFANEVSVDLVVANSHKAQLGELIKAKSENSDFQKVHKSNIFRKEDLGKGGGFEKGHTRSFLKIQDGCNSFCSFCVIPYGRGKSQSISIKENISRVNEIYESGVRELVITGVHIGDYADEELGEKRTLEDLVEQVLIQTQMPRIRLSSLEPIELTERLLKTYKNPRMCPHFHMSIQSAQSRVLKAMKRNYDATAVEKSLNEIAQKLESPFVGMDVIAGFPGETEEEHQETLERLRSLPWSRIHVFPYSPRPGVAANRLEGQLDRSVIMRRAAELRELSFERLKQRAEEQVGSVKEVLVLNSGVQGLSRDYWNIKLDQKLKVGELAQVKVLKNQSEFSQSQIHLSGEVL